MIKQVVAIFILVAFANARNYPLYKQCDSRWANDQLGTSKNTICSAGCLMSSAAMALSAIGSSQTPATLNAWLKGHGGYVSDDLFVWASINPLGVRFAGFISNSVIASNIAADNIVIVNVHNGGHWVLVTSMLDANTVAVNDPGYSTTSYPLSQVVAGNTGLYRVGNSLMGMMIGELEMMFNVGGMKKKLIEAAKGILEE
jgi:hypothetical protein